MPTRPPLRIKSRKLLSMRATSTPFSTRRSRLSRASALREWARMLKLSASETLASRPVAMSTPVKPDRSKDFSWAWAEPVRARPARPAASKAFLVFIDAYPSMRSMGNGCAPARFKHRRGGEFDGATLDRHIDVT
ncbi:hypothetical protein D3C86_1795070 [compost metagenome]